MSNEQVKINPTEEMEITAQPSKIYNPSKHKVKHLTTLQEEVLKSIVKGSMSVRSIASNTGLNPRAIGSAVTTLNKRGMITTMKVGKETKLYPDDKIVEAKIINNPINLNYDLLIQFPYKR